MVTMSVSGLYSMYINVDLDACVKLRRCTELRYMSCLGYLQSTASGASEGTVERV